MTRALLLPLVLGFGCGGGEPGNLLVRFLSDRQIPAEAESLEVAVASGETGAELGRERYPLAPIGAFPATLGINPADDVETLLIEARLYVGEAVVAVGAAQPSILPDVTRQVDVTLVEDVPP